MEQRGGEHKERRVQEREKVKAREKVGVEEGKVKRDGQKGR